MRNRESGEDPDKKKKSKLHRRRMKRAENDIINHNHVYGSIWPLFVYLFIITRDNNIVSSLLCCVHISYCNNGKTDLSPDIKRLW